MDLLQWRDLLDLLLRLWVLPIPAEAQPLAPEVVPVVEVAGSVLP
jgi:hypothetical protein